jgi:hypothetical protein
MDYEGLRDAIALALPTTIGTYTFPDGNTTTALRLEIGEQGRLPSGAVCDGLEIVVIALPQYTLKPIVGGYQITTRAAVHLKQWDQSKALIGVDGDGALQKVLDALMLLDIDISPNVSGVLPFEKLGNIETATIEVSTMVSHA